jgi:hypothetical protein
MAVITQVSVLLPAALGSVVAVFGGDAGVSRPPAGRRRKGAC